MSLMRFRQVDSHGLINGPAHHFGSMPITGLDQSGASAARMAPNVLYAVPFLLAQDSIMVNAFAACINLFAGTPVVRFGLYGISCLSYPIPTRMVITNQWAAQGSATVSVTTSFTIASLPGSIALSGTRLFWVAAMTTDSLRLIAGGGETTWAIFGYEPRSLGGYGMVTASWDSTTNLPSLFPAVTLSTSAAPYLGLRYVPT